MNPLPTRRSPPFHLKLDAAITVAQGHGIALNARNRVMAQHQVLNLMTHVDPVNALKKVT
ncbi:MAG: cation transporter dimerization domain-containing protein [Burkholderiaceae bacterium]